MIFLTDILKRTLENPSTPLSDPDAWLADAWGGGKSASGVSVTYASALKYPAVWRAVNLISRDVGKLPWYIYRNVGEGKERAADHPAYRLLKYKPNPYQTSFQFRTTMQARALLLGNGYAQIFRRADGRPAEMYMLPNSTRVETKGGALVYIAEINRKDQTLSSRDVFHIRGLGDGFVGESVISKAKDSMGLGIAAQNWSSKMFANGARPSVVLEHPAEMTPEAEKKLRESWQSNYGGLDNAYKVAILEEGMKLQAFSMNAEDAQLLGTRTFEIREIANWFGVPPHKLGDTTRTAYASLEQENQSYLDDAVDPWLCNWETEAWDKLLTAEEQEQDEYSIEFLRQALIRANIKDRGIFYSKALQSGWMNRDEVRRRENLNPIPDGEGKKFFIPVNMDLSGEEGKKDDDDDDDDKDDDSTGSRMRTLEKPIQGLIFDLALRMARRVSIQAKKAAKKPEGFVDWLETEVEARNRKTFIEKATPAAGVIASLCGRDAGEISEEIWNRFYKYTSEALWEATEAMPENLAKEVDGCCLQLEQILPETMSRRYEDIVKSNELRI